jgi:hypothetical protein
MQSTVDQAHAAVPRTLADIIEDARRAVCGHCCADSPAWACSFSGTGPEGCTWRGSPGLASGA